MRLGLEKWFAGSKTCSLSMCGRGEKRFNFTVCRKLSSEYSSPVLMDTLCRLISSFKALTALTFPTPFTLILSVLVTVVLYSQY